MPVVKVIHLVRHGRSTANEAMAELERRGVDPAVHQAMAEAERRKADGDEGGDGDPRQDPRIRRYLEVAYGAMNDPRHFDTALCPEGVQQASSLARRGEAGGRPSSAEVQLVVASSLSRAVHTAALVFPASEGYPRPILCLDEVREFAGPPVSEKRRAVSAMREHLRGPPMCLSPEEVDVSRLPEEDDLWRPAEEGPTSAFARADRALHFLVERPERVIACVSHTSFMRQCLLGRRNRSVVVEGSPEERRHVWRPFENTEVRSVELWEDPADGKFHMRLLPAAAAARASSANASRL